MGRARNHHDKTPYLRSHSVSTSTRYEDFAREKLHVSYLTEDSEVHAALDKLEKLAPSRVAVDFETVSKNGRWGVMNGSLSLIQLGVDEPERGIAPQQWLIDCQRCDPRPCVALLENPQIEKLIHFLDFELEWARVHLGARTITPIYDTCLAWQVINKKLKAMPDDAVQAILPGWEKHNAKLGTLAERYCGLAIPKEDQASNWGLRPLAAHQIIYAATDVAILPLLVARTRQTADKLGLSTEVDKRISYVKSLVHKRVGATRSHGDDLPRVCMALKRSRSQAELDAVWQAARQMTLTAPSSERVRALYERQRTLIS
jgi:ribonuclease D